MAEPWQLGFQDPATPVMEDEENERILKKYSF
ncbi:hypothetical protein PC114_g14530 [Phytophthora cactorum]|nr:hypothetical protein PC114_g14530 [Phytophthora cactorum]